MGGCASGHSGSVSGHAPLPSGRALWVDFPDKTVGRLRLCEHRGRMRPRRSEEHTSELQSHSDLVCRLLLEKKKIIIVDAAAVTQGYIEYLRSILASQV